MPLKYELIVSNPPWINARPFKDDDFESGNFDYEEETLKSIFKLSQDRLQTKGVDTKDGTLLLIYSDLSANLGLSTKSVIEDLCAKHELLIRDKRSVSFKGTNKREEKKILSDPLSVYKNVSHLTIYEITRR